ncbi:MAG: type II toxin-antitoxin system VapB family antitoxin [Chloroflexi bacterium]|nr:type II toxin-antitoxin system VapB family antitoxin [Chloroflexota bacterium]
MSRTTFDIDEEASAEVMRRYRLATKREAINYALRTLAAEPLSVVEARALRGIGWEGDLDDMRSNCQSISFRAQREF